MKYKMKVPDKDLIYLYQDMLDFDKQIARFHVDLASNTPVEDQHTARFMVATSSCIHVGHTLAEALVLGLLEPDFRRAYMLQLFCRHHRQGNKNHLVYTFLFLATVSPVEEKIQEVNQWRATIDQSAQRKAREVLGTTAEKGIIISDEGSLAGGSTSGQPKHASEFDESLYNDI
jgi:hypothetical protein